MRAEIEGDVKTLSPASGTTSRGGIVFGAYPPNPEHATRIEGNRVIETRPMSYLLFGGEDYENPFGGAGDFLGAVTGEDERKAALELLWRFTRRNLAWATIHAFDGEHMRPLWMLDLSTHQHMRTWVRIDEAD